MIFLDLDDLLHVARRTLGEVELRDVGLLESASARPRATAFGEDAYPSIHAKAAALLHSIARNHPLVDGNKRLGLAAVLVFYRMNGAEITADNDDAYALIMSFADGTLRDVAAIAGFLRSHSRSRP